MKEYDATEVAYKNGFGAGFAEGLAAAGIAPIQWRDAAKCPFQPEDDEEYFVILEGSDRWYWCRYDMLDPFDASKVRFWVPMVLPIEIKSNKEETK